MGWVMKRQYRARGNVAVVLAKFSAPLPLIGTPGRPACSRMTTFPDPRIKGEGNLTQAKWSRTCCQEWRQGVEWEDRQRGTRPEP